jgi:O-antigen biosynthesis protein
MTATSNPPRDDPERFDPEHSPGTLVAAEHLARYRAAAALAAGRRVLDAGCGTGYGTQMLVHAGSQSVHGLDSAPDAVRATARLTGGAAEIVQGDIHQLPFDDASFDLVVCFEVIEHVEERDRVLAELRRVLTDDGLLVISTPNRDVYLPGNPHHVHEYTPDEFEAELRKLFATVRSYGQSQRLASVLSGEGGVAEAGDELVVEFLERSPAAAATYVVALATASGELPPLESVAIVADEFELRWWHDRVEGLERDIDASGLRRELAREAWARGEQAARLRELGERLLIAQAVGAEVVDLRRRYEEVMRDWERLLEDAEERADEIDSLNEQLAEATTRLHVVYRSVSWRLTKPLRALKGALRRSDA